MIVKLQCGHEQQVDAPLSAGSLRICREGDCSVDQGEKETRVSVVETADDPADPVDDAIMLEATNAVEAFGIAGREVMREFLRTIPDGIRPRVGRLVLRTLLVELEELPETICGEPE